MCEKYNFELFANMIHKIFLFQGINCGTFLISEDFVLNISAKMRRLALYTSTLTLALIFSIHFFIGSTLAQIWPIMSLVRDENDYTKLVDKFISYIGQDILYRNRSSNHLVVEWTTQIENIIVRKDAPEFDLNKTMIQIFIFLVLLMPFININIASLFF